MTPLTSSSDLRQAYVVLRDQLVAGAQRLKRAVGYQGGGGHYGIYWRPVDRYWLLPNDDQEEGRYWICVGLEDPHEIDNLTITCEFNPPKSGVNRRTAGRFLRHDDGRIHLAHSGRVGGGRPGIGKTEFLAWYKGAKLRLRWVDGFREEVIVLGDIADPAVATSIGQFARSVDAFKRQAVKG